jgi:hypothetical protein
MRLQDERGALDGGGVGAFAALGEALVDEPLRVGEQSNALAGGALAAEVVGEALAVGGLGEHARESEFAYTARAGEEQGMRDAVAPQGTAEGRYDTFVAEEVGEAHG